MMAKQELPNRVDVHLAVGATSERIGRLRRSGDAIAFEWHPRWADERAVPLLGPDILPTRGPQYPADTGRVFGFIADASPDRWGRLLMQRRDLTIDGAAGALTPWRMLLEVDDATRLGALRFSLPNHGPPLEGGDPAFPVPPLTDLRALAAATNEAEKQPPESTGTSALDWRWLRMLVAPGASLGGARPKCNVRDGAGDLWIAKFPSIKDTLDVGRWEAITAELARRAGIDVPETQMVQLGNDHSGHHIFLSRRFDRDASGRQHFLSAMTMTQHVDGEPASYLDVLQVLDDYGAAHLDAEREALYRRIAFNAAVSNRDDHLRNHGFIYQPSGLRLAPAFDMNPAPDSAQHVLSLDGQHGPNDRSALESSAGLFGLDAARRDAVLETVDSAVAQWREVAAAHQAPASEIRHFSRCFDAAGARPGLK